MTNGPTARGDEASSSIGPKPSIAEVAAWLRRAAEDGDGTEDLTPVRDPDPEPAGGPTGGGPSGAGGEPTGDEPTAEGTLRDEVAASREQPSGREAATGRPVGGVAVPPEAPGPEVDDGETDVPDPPAGQPSTVNTVNTAHGAPSAGTASPAVPTADPPTPSPVVAATEESSTDQPSADSVGEAADAEKCMPPLTLSPPAPEPLVRSDALAAPSDAPTGTAPGTATPPSPGEPAAHEAEASPGQPAPRPFALGPPERAGNDFAPAHRGTPPAPAAADDPPRDAGTLLEPARPETDDEKDVVKPVDRAVTGTTGTSTPAPSAPAPADEPTEPPSASPERGPTSLFDLDLAELAARARASAASGASVKGQPPKARTPIELPAPAKPQTVPAEGREPRPDPVTGLDRPDRPDRPAPMPLISASTALDPSKERAGETVSGDVNLEDPTHADDAADKPAPARGLRLPSNLRLPTGLRLPSSLQSQRTRYPRGQLKERIGLLRRVRAMLGVVVVTVLLGVAAGAAIGAFLLFLAFAIRGAITSG